MLAFCILMVGLPGLTAFANQSTQDRSAWQTGKSLERQLQAPVGIAWSDNPLRNALERLSQNQRVKIVLDRRVDPNTPIRIKIRNVPLQEALDQIASETKLGIGWVGPVAYFGPRDSARNLATITEKLRRRVDELPDSARQRWQRSSVLKWADLDEPRQLIRDVIKDSKVEIAGVESITHDLWAASELPQLARFEQLVLLTAGFDKTIEISAEGKGKIVDAPEHVFLVREFELNEKTPELVALLKQIQKAGGRVRLSALKLRVSGRAEQHQAIARLIRGPDPSPVSIGEKRYTLTVKNATVEALLRDVAGRLDLELTVKAQIDKRRLQQRVSIELNQGTLDDLLHAACDPANLNFRIDDGKLNVFSK